MIASRARPLTHNLLCFPYSLLSEKVLLLVLSKAVLVISKAVLVIPLNKSMAASSTLLMWRKLKISANDARI